MNSRISRVAMALFLVAASVVRPLAEDGHPLLDDLGNDASAETGEAGVSQSDIEFVGYGLCRVGTRSLERTGRLWASVPSGEVRATPHLLSFGTSSPTIAPRSGCAASARPPAARATRSTASGSRCACGSITCCRAKSPPRAHVSPDLMSTGPSREGPVRVALPTQANACADGEGASGDGRYSRVVATVRDVLRDKDHPLVLRAYRRATSGSSRAATTLDASTDCEGRALTGVSLQYVAKDNPGLRPGLYRGRVVLEAHGGPGGPGGGRVERVAVQVNIDTL